MCGICWVLFILWQVKNRFKYGRITYYALNLLMFGLGFLIAGIWSQPVLYLNNVGTHQHSYNAQQHLQGSIQRCPLISGVGYLIGFNGGLLYFLFRTHRNKFSLIIIRILKHKINRVLSSIISLSILTFVILYFNKLYP